MPNCTYLAFPDPAKMGRVRWVDFPPTKLLPRSHLVWQALVWKRTFLRTFLNELACMGSRSLMWIALLSGHVKTRPQRLVSAAPPLVRLVCTVHGPNASKATLVKGAQSLLCLGGGLPSSVTAKRQRHFPVSLFVLVNPFLHYLDKLGSID